MIVATLSRPRARFLPSRAELPLGPDIWAARQRSPTKGRGRRKAWFDLHAIAYSFCALLRLPGHRSRMSQPVRDERLPGRYIWAARQHNPTEKGRIWILVFLVSAWAALGADSDSPVSFRKDIAPILQKKCVACHGPEKSKGDFRLHTFELLSRGGSSKSAAITPEHPEQSELFKRITTREEDDRMPQKDDPLPPAQIVLIERWLRQGAKFDGPDPKMPLALLIPREPYPNPPEVYPRPVPILALAFSPNGRELAAGGYHEITVWNPTDGKLLRRIRDVAERTHALRYNSDGSLLAAAGGTPGKIGEVKLIDPASGITVKTLATIADVMFAASFSPDGKRLAAAGSDNTIRVFDAATGQQELLIEQHADWVLSVSWSGDGEHLVSASRDKSARIFSAKTGEMEQAYLGHNEPVFAAVFSDDGKKVFSAGRDRKIRVWNTSDAKGATEKSANDVGTFEGEIFCLARDAKNLFAASADKTVREYSIDKRESVRTFLGHTDWVYCLALDPVSQRVASGGYDGEIRIWNIENGELLLKFFGAPGFQESSAAAQAR